jgi:hypothetical protein
VDQRLFTAHGNREFNAIETGRSDTFLQWIWPITRHLMDQSQISSFSNTRVPVRQRQSVPRRFSRRLGCFLWVEKCPIRNHKGYLRYSFS